MFKLSLSDFVRADAGNAEAQHDQRYNAMHTAYRAALQAGQKTPLLHLQAQCALYSTPKACRALTDNQDKTTAQATKACKVYGAYKLALDTVGIPVKTTGDADTMAATMAGEFVALVTAALAPVPVDAAAQAKAKEERDAKAAQAKAAADKAASDKVAAAVAIAEANHAALAPTLADMVRIVANALATGLLDDDAINTIADASDAYQTAETARLMAAPLGDAARPAIAA